MFKEPTPAEAGEIIAAIAILGFIFTAGITIGAIIW